MLQALAQAKRLRTWENYDSELEAMRAAEVCALLSHMCVCVFVCVHNDVCTCVYIYIYAYSYEELKTV
jgi:hypothetical protein